MVIIYHKNNSVTKIVTDQNVSIAFDTKASIAAIFIFVANAFPESKIVWCHLLLQDSLNIDAIATLFHHNKMMISYSSGPTNFLGNKIGYLEESPFIKVNKDVRYPTWLMSSDMGVIHASVLNVIPQGINLDKNFEYFLNSLSKLRMPLGLFCYSEPGLLLDKNAKYFTSNVSLQLLFRFIKQHYKTRWAFLLFVNLALYEKRFLMFQLLHCLFFKNRKNTALTLENIEVESTLNVLEQKTIDVVIPTIGREKYLYDVLKDLAQQTHLPINVIIIEQNPNPKSISELSYLKTDKWPFTIKHTFTHQTGACNARNLALSQVESEWVFLADDDIRFNNSFFRNAIERIKQHGTYAITTSCLRKNEKQEYNIITQSGIFGSGNSFVKKRALQNLIFDTALEFGYGEDTDFGLQLRNQGYDVIYFPDLHILHLKAPMGGFRTRFIQQWENEKIQPKPSPTLMYVFQKHYTNQQLLGYKTVLFLKLIKKESITNYWCFISSFQKKWLVSQYWASKLKNETK